MPRDENNSWCDRVGRPESVETTYKTHKSAKLRMFLEIIISHAWLFSHQLFSVIFVTLPSFLLAIFL